ncbi:glutathione S-transferase [Diaporthe eres]|uniref:GST C-terminal domain-containing protein n=1 Tax=Diaporthe vaccinii TaxID=105482 RepID=A0ABR4FBG6_9PEZI|nr:glutathione S-transferase [Diaporthe eres]
MSSEQPFILYHYPFSPYARRIVWYLQLRGIPYKQCMQPPIMPRPDVAKLGIKYRRIPVMSIGRDVYLDTRLILQKLESFPASAPRLGAAENTEQRATERLLEVLSVDGGVFAWAASLLPRELPIFKDPNFLKDRADFMGGRNMLAPKSPTAKPEALNDIRNVFELLETTLLADGRDWVLKTEGPSLADIEAVWPLHWLIGLPGALPSDLISKTQFPKVFSWIQRFDKTANAARQKLGKVPTVSGEDAARAIVQSSYFESAVREVEQGEPLVKALGLKKGDNVVVFPLDSGSTHKDSGVILSLDGKEIVFETKTDLQGSPVVRVHAPRHGFRIVREDQASHL